MEIGLRIRRSFFFLPPRSGTAHRPLIFCDWWKSSMVDNFAFNKRQSSISERYRLMEEKYFLRLLWPVTSYYVRILYAELNAEFCLSVYLKSSATRQVYVCIRIRVRVCGCVVCVRNISADIAVRREDWTGQHAKFRQVIFVRGILHPYWCILRRLKAGIDRKSCLLLYARVTTWFPRRRRWSPTSNCVKGWSRIF